MEVVPVQLFYGYLHKRFRVIVANTNGSIILILNPLGYGLYLLWGKKLTEISVLAPKIDDGINIPGDYALGRWRGVHQIFLSHNLR